MNLDTFAVVPVLTGPIQVLLALLPSLLVALGAALLAMLRPKAIWAGIKLLWAQKIGVAVFAGAVVGAVFLARAMLPGRVVEVQKEEATSDAWTMFRGGLKRRGSIDGAPGPSRGGLNWSFADGGPTYYSTPTVLGNRVYVTSADKGPLRDRGAIYCLDADTGGLVWRTMPRGFRATFSSPAVSGRFLVCGEGLHFTRDARVVCLDVRRQGETLWMYRTNSHVESSPCIYEDRVFIGAGDDGYYCFRLEPGDNGEPVVLWHAEAEKYPDAETSPAAWEGKVFVGLGMGGRAICCLDAEKGDELWRVETPYPVFGPPTVADDAVFVAMGNGNFIQPAEEVRRIELDKLREQGADDAAIAEAEKRLGPIGELWRLDPDSGDVAWKFTAGRTVLGAVAAGDDKLYFGSRDGCVYCVSFDGKELARFNTHSPIVTSPALAGEHVYAVTESGKLYGLSADGLELVWETTLAFQGPFLGSPTIARGHAYVGSPADGLLCLGMPGQDERKPFWAGLLAGPGRGGSIDDEPLPERGRLDWRFPAAEESDGPGPLLVTAPVACLEDRLYVPVHGKRNGLVCLKHDPGSRDGPTELWAADCPAGVWLSPAATTEVVCFVDGQPGDASRNLRCLDAADGSPRWELSVGAGASGQFVLGEEGDGLLVDAANGLACFDLEGNVRWRAEVGRVQGLPAFQESMVVVATEDPPALLLLDRPTGLTLWHTDLPAAPATGPVPDKDTIYLGTGIGVAAFHLVDGSQIWEAPSGTPTGPLTLDRGTLAYVNSDSELVLVDAATGAPRERVAGALPVVPPLVSRDAVLFAGKDGLMRHNTAMHETQLWMRTGWMGPITSPAVMAGSRVFFGTEGRGLICAEEKKAR
jgi:outer membrane protein assembly factor BamB